MLLNSITSQDDNRNSGLDANGSAVKEVQRPGARRYMWLDAARGIAAIAVMLYHYSELIGFEWLFSISYLAVDLFFMLSGFVLLHAYGHRMADGLSASKYIIARLVRLYPVFILATLIGATYFVIKVLAGADDAPPMLGVIIALGQNIFFLPSTAKGTGLDGIFPFSPASWSLAAELFVSVVFGLGIWKFRNSALWAVVAVAGAIFAIFAWQAGSVDLGFNRPTFNAGLFRALSEFCLGMLLYRYSRYVKGVPTAVTLLILAAVTATFLFAPVSWPMVIFAILVLFPVLILIQPDREPTGAVARVCEVLGDLSYPVYLLHTPILLWCLGVLTTLQIDFRPFLPWLGFVIAAITIVASVLATIVWDRPIRGLMNSMLAAKAASGR